MDANIILTAIVKCKNAVLGGYAVSPSTVLFASC
jgi:hypothetical protein